MRLTIDNKSKQEMFVAMLQLLKNWSAYIIMNFEKDRLYIQSMDKSHVCLADIDIKNTWFGHYECSKNNKISVDSSHLSILMNYALKHNVIEFIFTDEINVDKLFINFLNNNEKKGSFDHFFELPLIDVEEDNLGIPNVEYEVEFTIEAKKFVEVLSELYTFGSDLNVLCNENVLELNSSGDSAKLKVNIPIDDLNEYSITENDELDVSFSLSHICKMCTSTKLGTNIIVSLSHEYPMSLKYELGDGSNAIFYIAPKVMD